MKVFRRGNAGEIDYILPKVKQTFGSSFRSYWSSPESWATACNGINPMRAWHTSAWQTGDPAWYGTQNFDEAVKLARDGWPEGIKKAESLLNRIKAKYPIQLKPKKYGIAGTHPNVPRAISGNPLNMHIPDKAKGKRKIITLLSEMGAHCGHDGEEFINRAAVVAAIVDSIEANGYACDVITYSNSNGGSGGLFGYEDGKHNALHSVYVKNSNQPVDIARLAFGLGHPAMFRRFAFSEKGGLEENKPLGDGLGYTKTLSKTCDDVHELKEKNIFNLIGINDTKAFKTAESAATEGVAYIINDLNEQGFPLYVS